MALLRPNRAKTSVGGGFIKLPGGLHVPASVVPPPPKIPSLGKKPPAGPVGIKSRLDVGEGKTRLVVEYSTAEAKPEHHKLEPDERRARRSDNKFMKRSRQMHRKRRKHGR